jgi:hypothetical protein
MADSYQISAEAADLAAAALTSALIGRGRQTPSTLDDAYSAAGTDRGANGRLARSVAGIPQTGKLPPKGSPERRRYLNAQRNVERYRKGRRPRAQLPRILEGARRLAAGDNIAALLRNGADMQIRARIKVSNNWRTHTMPADVGTGRRMQYVEGQLFRLAVRQWQAGNMQAAGEEVLRAFFFAYWGTELPADVGAVEYVRLEIA